MKRIFLSGFVLCIFLSATGQQHSQEYIDSIQNKYLKNGAYQYNYFSPKWQLYIDSALALTPENAYLWQQKAMPLFKARKYEIGMQAIDKAVALNPEEYLDYRAFIKCIFSKQYRESIVDFEKATALQGDIGLMDHSYKFYTALCHLQLNEFERAKSLFLEVVAQDAKTWKSDSIGHPVRFFYTGIVYQELGDNISAEKYFRLAIVNYEQFSDAEYYLAIALGRQQKHKEAEAMMLQAKKDFEIGYTFTEDQVFYETYPYQIKKWFFRAFEEE